MKYYLNLTYLIFVIAVSSSCGSSEKTSDEILRLGGISSTGKKDEPERDKKSDSTAPAVPNAMCENPVDLTNRMYSRASMLSDEECGNGSRNNLCIVSLSFVGKSSLVARYLGDTSETPAFINTEYFVCESDLTTTIHKTRPLTLSSDQTLITDTLLGLSFKLVDTRKK